MTNIFVAMAEFVRAVTSLACRVFAKGRWVYNRCAAYFVALHQVKKGGIKGD